jgi:CelD/BcsL family acetyltransferase involved in cellulose biosynthesis
MPDRYSIVCSSIPDADALAREWRALDRGGGSFFTAWPWIGTWLELVPEAASFRLLRLQDGGQCRGIAIAVQRQARRHGLIRARQLHINATGRPEYDALTIEHNGLAGRGSQDLEMWGALLRWFRSDAAELDELAIAGTTCRIADMDGSLLAHEREVGAYRVDLDRVRVLGGGVGAILSANSRQQLARSFRTLSAAGPLRLDAAATTEQALGFFDRLQRLHMCSWTRRGQIHGFAYPFVDAFHRKLIERLAPRREVELLRLSAGDRELGYLYNFRRDRVVYAYQSGFDDTDRRLRPGYVAHAMAIERAARQGDSTYDFMAGSNRLKQSFATERYPMYWYVFQKPLIRFKAERAARAFKHVVTGDARARREGAVSTRLTETDKNEFADG